VVVAVVAVGGLAMVIVDMLRGTKVLVELGMKGGGGILVVLVVVKVADQ